MLHLSATRVTANTSRRRGDGAPKSMPILARELVALNPDVIVALDALGPAPRCVVNRQGA